MVGPIFKLYQLKVRGQLYSKSLLSSETVKPLCTEASQSSFPSENQGKGVATSQAGFLDLKKVNIMWILPFNNDKMRYTCSILLFLIWFELHIKRLYVSLICPACDVTAWVREG